MAPMRALRHHLALLLLGASLLIGPPLGPWYPLAHALGPSDTGADDAVKTSRDRRRNQLRAFHDKGVALCEQGRWEEAMGNIGRGFAFAYCAMLVAPGIAEVPSTPQRSSHHDHVGGYATWCALHVVRREYRQAIEDCDEALAEDANDADAHSNRSAAYLMMAEIDRAIVDMEAALRLNPADATLHYNRALLHMKKGEYAAAVAEYTETVRLAPGHAFAYNNRGVVYERLGERDKAIVDYRKALELAPGLTTTRKNLRRLGAE